MPAVQVAACIRLLWLRCTSLGCLTPPIYLCARFRVHSGTVVPFAAYRPCKRLNVCLRRLQCALLGYLTPSIYLCARLHVRACMAILFAACRPYKWLHVYFLMAAVRLTWLPHAIHLIVCMPTLACLHGHSLCCMPATQVAACMFPLAAVRLTWLPHAIHPFVCIPPCVCLHGHSSCCMPGVPMAAPRPPLAAVRFTWLPHASLLLCAHFAL